MKKIKLTPEHVGLPVYCIMHGKGWIVKYGEGMLPVKAEFQNGGNYQYTASGKFLDSHENRVLFIGHDVYISVVEDTLIQNNETFKQEVAK